MAESQTCKEIINDIQRNIRIEFHSCISSESQLFKRAFYLKQISVITGGPLAAEGLEQLPPPLIRPGMH